MRPSSNYKSTQSHNFFDTILYVTCTEGKDIRAAGSWLSGGDPSTFIDISSTQQRERQSYLNRLARVIKLLRIQLFES